MVLTDRQNIADWIRRAAYDGRDLTTPYPDDKISEIGWHYYMTPEDAARGIILMESTPRINDDPAGAVNYTDLTTLPCFSTYRKDSNGH
jgi:dTDP-4-amino-4,6-dideoxygalactose transaminase